MEEKDKNKLKKWLGSGSINIFGRPFSGKDTQSKRLADLFNTKIISGGDIMRASKNDKIKNSVDKGDLAPQKEYLSLVLPFLSNEIYRGKPLILNSLGRWHGEESPILSATHNTRHPVRAVIYLDIPETEVWKRWEEAEKNGDRGVRNDDNNKSISNRLSEFKNKTLPVIKYYENLKILITIDGTQHPDDVYQEILRKLRKHVSDN
jgi:adenylate kinase